MYFTEGLNPNELGDFEMVEHEGTLHCFYLTLPNHDVVGHLASEDGINWRPMPDAIRTGGPGDFDGDQIWTMGVCRFKDRWLMLYTANQMRGMMQVVGLAASKDLVNWEKHPANPVMKPDPRWYESETEGKRRVDFRDPHMVVRDGRIHCFVCARTNEGLLNRRGCAAYYVSEDGVNWQAQPPACRTADCYDWECPSVFKIGGRWYMTAIAGGCRKQAYAIADEIGGPYLRPADDCLTPGINMSVRPCVFKGKTHLFHWQRGEADWTYSPMRYNTLASPKSVRADSRGELLVESFDWSEMYQDEQISLNAETGFRIAGQWNSEGDVLRAENINGAAMFLSKTEYSDYVLRATVELDSESPAREFGLALRADSEGDTGLFPTCSPGRYRSALVKYIHNRPRGPESLARGRSVEQEHHLAPSPDGRYEIYAVVFGPSVEFNVNGKLTLAHCSMQRRAGHVGFFLHEGAARISCVSIQPLKQPSCEFQF